jgi:hypothetical protein
MQRYITVSKQKDRGPKPPENGTASIFFEFLELIFKAVNFIVFSGMRVVSFSRYNSDASQLLNAPSFITDSGTYEYGTVRYGTVRYDSVVSGLSEKMNKFLIDQFKFCSIMFVSCVLDPQSFQCGSGSIYPSQPGFRFLDPEPK